MVRDFWHTLYIVINACIAMSLIQKIYAYDQQLRRYSRLRQVKFKGPLVRVKDGHLHH